MTGYITGSVVLRGIGAATAASPLPKVFSDVDGLETFASEFTLRYRDANGIVTEHVITPELYGRLGGPTTAATSTAPRCRMRRDSPAPVAGGVLLRPRA